MLSSSETEDATGKGVLSFGAKRLSFSLSLSLSLSLSRSGWCRRRRDARVCTVELCPSRPQRDDGARVDAGERELLSLVEGPSRLDTGLDSAHSDDRDDPRRRRVPARELRERTAKRDFVYPRRNQLARDVSQRAVLFLGEEKNKNKEKTRSQRSLTESESGCFRRKKARLRARDPISKKKNHFAQNLKRGSVDERDDGTGADLRSGRAHRRERSERGIWERVSRRVWLPFPKSYDSHTDQALSSP